ncbi:hypothetical protein [Stenotrophomonas phage A1432]|uniref:Uncharacterized protein n=1 Tax=Stenotrophomonas phage A1432 TaxID=2930315 RepID=A0A9E7SSK1_9CAUD|nr:hypothetical protein P9A45_gp32 [Stenotrophomonas phage A1432]UTC27998.1 hypothetical protein [Stenotrophomonas phage A1432]
MRVSLRVHKEAIAALRKEGFEVTPLRRGKGDHMILGIARNGVQAKISISGSPSCEFLRPLITSAYQVIERVASQRR